MISKEKKKIKEKIILINMKNYLKKLLRKK